MPMNIYHDVTGTSSTAIVRPACACVWGVVCGVVAVLACVGLCVPARAVDAVDWRIEDMGVRGAWASGVTGKGVTVAVIDDQVVADHPSLKGADVEYRLALKGGDSCRGRDDASKVMSKENSALSTSDGFYVTHGTAMVGLIAGTGAGYDGGMGFQGIAPGAHVIAYPYAFPLGGGIGGSAILMACVNDADPGGHYLIESALADAVDSGARVVNMSFGGADNMVLDYYLPAALHALRHGVVLVSGRANDTVTPGMYDLVGDPEHNEYFPGTVTTNSAARDGSISSASDVMDGNVSILSPGVGVPAPEHADTLDRRLVFTEGGTSSATADLSGYLALVFQKWPHATGNQVLQSLVRNTKGNTSGGAVLDPGHRRGFGMVDPARLLSTDPTGYPDVNPLLEWAVKASDRHEETRGLYTGDYSKLGKYGERISDPFSPDGDTIECDDSCGLIGGEYRRQARAWARVEQCRRDGGKDCMRYSATATAGRADKDAGWTGDGSSAKPGKSSVPGWVVPVAAVGGVIAVGGIVLAVVLVRRKRKAGAGVPPAAPAGMGPVPGVPAGSSPFPSASGAPAWQGPTAAPPWNPGRPRPQPPMAGVPAWQGVPAPGAVSVPGTPVPAAQPPVPAPGQSAQPRRSSVPAPGTQASAPLPPVPGASDGRPPLPRRR